MVDDGMEVFVMNEYSNAGYGTEEIMQRDRTAVYLIPRQSRVGFGI